MRFFIFYSLIITLLLPFPAAAVAQNNAGAVSIARAENYLQNLNTLKARFLQTAHNGSQLVGTFYLNRPGKLRFEYDEPIEDFIVADGFFIYFYDSELGEQSNAPIGQTLADFLLRPDISLSGDIAVENIMRSENLLQIKITQSVDPAAGSLTLGFEENPFKLKKWRVTDAQGLITEIELFNMETGIDLDKSLFIYMDPKRHDAPRFND